jgi:hypothetical protein
MAGFHDPQPFLQVARTETLVDTDQWLRALSAQHIHHNGGAASCSSLCGALTSTSTPTSLMSTRPGDAVNTDKPRPLHGRRPLYGW